MIRRFQQLLLRSRRRQVQICGDNSVQIQCAGNLVIRRRADDE